MIPGGWEVTFPDPVPDLDTVNENCCPTVVEENEPATPPIVSVVVTVVSVADAEVCLTQTDCPEPMMPTIDVNEDVQPIEYSPPDTDMGAKPNSPVGEMTLETQ